MKCKKLIFILLAAASFLSCEEEKQERSWIAMAQDLYARMLDGTERQDWKYVIHHGRLLATRFIETPYANDANYYIAVSHYMNKEYTHANRFFSKYLETSENPKYFEEALTYKFDIATKYEEGQCKRMFGKKRLPKFVPAKGDALEIYDEVITSMPRSEMAAIATYRKGSLLFLMKEHKLAVETFQTLIRRYPKNPLAPDSYIAISKVFLDQCKREFPDPELLDRADLNYEKFKNHFPSEPRLNAAYATNLKMKEELAKELYSLGDFYERTKHPRAATIYYSNIVTKYPATVHAEKAKTRLKKLKGAFATIKAKDEKKPSIIAESDFNPLLENDKMVDMIDRLAEQ